MNRLIDPYVNGSPAQNAARDDAARAAAPEVPGQFRLAVYAGAHGGASAHPAHGIRVGVGAQPGEVVLRFNSAPQDPRAPMVDVAIPPQAVDALIAGLMQARGAAGQPTVPRVDVQAALRRQR